jgi:hypothetical protein
MGSGLSNGNHSLVRKEAVMHLAHRVLRRFLASIKTAFIEDAHTLGQLIEMQVESMTDELPREERKKAVGRIKVTPGAKEKARAWDAAVEHVLTDWCSKNMTSLNLGQGPLSDASTTEDVVEVMMELRGGAGYLYYMEHEEAGVGTWDGDWDVLFKTPRPTIKALSQHVLGATRQAYRSLNEALFDAALDTMPEEEIEKQAATKRAEWKAWTPHMPVQVVQHGRHVEEFDNLAEAQKKFPDLDPKHNTTNWTWATRGEIHGRPAIRFEDWESYKHFSMAASRRVARVFRGYMDLETLVKDTLRFIASDRTIIEKALGKPLLALGDAQLTAMLYDVYDTLDEITTTLSMDTGVKMARAKVLPVDKGVEDKTHEVLRGVSICKGQIERNLLHSLQIMHQHTGISDEAKFAIGQAVQATHRILGQFARMEEYLGHLPKMATEAATRVLCPRCQSVMLPASGAKNVFFCNACYKAGRDDNYYALKGHKLVPTPPPKTAAGGEVELLRVSVKPHNGHLVLRVSASHGDHYENSPGEALKRIESMLPFLYESARIDLMKSKA